MKEHEQELLVHGIKEYPDALNAIEAFRELLQDKFRSVVEKNLNSYAKALRIKTPELKDHEYHPRDGTHFVVGVKFKSRLQKGLDAEFIHCLVWSEDEETEASIFGMELRTIVCCRKKNLDRLDEASSKASTVLQRISGELYLKSTLEIDDAGNIDCKLETLLQDWIDVWQKVGGIKALAGDDSDDDESSE